MAIFNPQVPQTQDPNYLNYSRVVEAPPPDTSTKIALETAGAALDTGVSTFDTAIKKGITDQAFKAIDPLRDEMTSGLEKIKASLDQGIIPKPAQGVAGSILDAHAEEEPDLPVGLESGLNRIQQLALAKTMGSVKLNDTQYAKDTLSVAKQLRAQYGGYREYIDQKVSEASGLPVANSYYQNMLLDINRQMNQMGKVKDDVGKALMAAQDMPGQAGYIARRNAGDPKMTDNFILQKINDHEVLKGQQKIDAANRAEADWTKENNKQDIDQRLTRRLSSSVRMEMSSVKDLAGVGTPSDLLNYFNDVSMGKIKQSDAEVGQKKSMFNAWVVQVKRRITDDAVGDGAVIGSDVAMKRVEAAMDPIYTMQKLVNSKEDGPAFYHAQQIEAIKNDDVHGFLTNKDSQAIGRQFLTNRAIMGDTFFPQYLASLLGSKVMDPFNDIFKEEAMSSISPITDKRGNAIPRYMVDAYKHGKAIGAGNLPGDDYFGKITGLITDITNPQMPLAAKDAKIEWAFNPKNGRALDELKMDYRDPNTGEWVPGKYRAFNILSAPAVTQAVKETALLHPDNYQKYQSTLEQQFGSLYRADLLNLNKIMAKPYLNAHFSFNDKTNSFGLVDDKNRPLAPDPHAMGVQYPDKVYLNGIFDVLDRVNKGIGNLANVHKNNPQGDKDTPQYLLQTLQTAGFRPGDKISGATEGMMKAVIKSRQPDMAPEELNKLLLKYPSGGVTPMKTDRTPVQ